MTHAVARLRADAELAFIILFAALLVSLAFLLETSIGAGHHLLLVTGGAVLGLGVGRRTRQ